MYKLFTLLLPTLLLFVSFSSLYAESPDYADSISAAKILPIYSVIDGEITMMDSDYFKIVLTTSTPIIIQTYRQYGQARMNTKLYLYDALGTQIAMDRNSNEDNFSIISKTLNAGTYYVKVTLNSFIPGHYTLSYSKGISAITTRNFSQYREDSIVGNMQIIGNSVKLNESNNCAGSTVSNNDINTTYADIDNDRSTYNSTSADLVLPQNITSDKILYALLYWQGRTENQNTVPRGGSVKIKLYGNTKYITVPSMEDKFDRFKENYQGIADITDIIKTSINDRNSTTGYDEPITVANVYAPLKVNGFGTWAIMIVYKDSTSKLQNISSYDGFLEVYSVKPASTPYPLTNAATVSVPISGFVTPTTGNVYSKFLVFAGEGDINYSDNVTLTDASGTVLPLGSNIFQSTTDIDGTQVTNRNPSCTNTLGTDIRTFEIGTTSSHPIIGNNQTSTIVQLTSNGDGFYPGLFALAIQLYTPRVCYYIDTIVDSTNNKIFKDKHFTQKININEDYTFNIWISNMKKAITDPNLETVTKAKIYMDMVDFNYTTGSTNIYNIGETAFRSISDNITNSLNDIGEYDINTTLSTWRVGKNADRDQGGKLEGATFSENSKKVFINFNGHFTSNANVTNIDLTDYLKFKASFAIEHGIEILPNNATAIEQCLDLNTSAGVTVGLSGGFNVIMTSKKTSMSSSNTDPINGGSDNAITTQVVNKPISITAVSLKKNTVTNDLTDLGNYKGLVAIELIEQPKYLSSDNDSVLKAKCTNANNLMPANTNIISFLGASGSTFADGTFTPEKANKNATFRIKYLTDGSTDKAINWTCSTKSTSCIRNFLSTNYTPTPCTTACSAGSSLSTCLACVFNLSYAKSTCARDNLAIRPSKFTFSNVPTFLTSGKDYNISLLAEQDSNSTASSDYNISNVKTNFIPLDNNKTIYNPDLTDGTASLHGTLKFGTITPTINDGFSNNISVNFNDVGLVNMKFIDNTWAGVDINNTADNTPLDCSATGAYICGSINAVFIPDHFEMSNETLNDYSGSSFTYLSNDLNISATLNVTLTAKNDYNNTTQNFTMNSWENNISLTFAVPAVTGMTANKKEIPTETLLGFTSGLKTITGSDANLSFNFTRNKDKAKNPFKIQGNAINLTATSTYDASHIVTNSQVASNSAIFVYARTHAPRQRFIGNHGTALIYYENYCSGNDFTGKQCFKSLLPNSTSLTSSDDPKWFINTAHFATAGKVGNVTQKATSANVVASGPTFGPPSTVILTYNENNGYPYKVTMENNASSWLIYNPNDASDTTNEFQVEFGSNTSSWAGVHETNTSTSSNASAKTNRRSMW